MGKAAIDNEMVFRYQKQPEGVLLDYTGIVYGKDTDEDESCFWMPIWHRDHTKKTFEKRYMRVRFLTSAIHQTEFVLRGYRDELDDLSQIDQLVSRAHQAFICGEYLSKEQTEALQMAFNMLIYVRNPHKVVARDAIIKTAMSPSTDSLGRRNPCSKAAVLLQALCNINEKRKPEIRIIVAQIAARREALKTVLDENHRIIDTILAELRLILRDPIFKSKADAPILTVNQYQRSLRKLVIDAVGLWGQPYCLIRGRIEGNVNSICRHLGHSQYQPAGTEMLGFVGELVAMPRTLKKLRGTLDAFRKSVGWKNQEQKTLQNGFLRIYEEYEGCCGDLGAVVNSLIESSRLNIVRANVAINNGNFSPAEIHIDTAYRRLQW